MFTSSSDRGVSSGSQSSSSPAESGASSAGLRGPDSPWLGLLSAVSRPALSMLQRYLPERLLGPAPGTGPDMRGSFAEEESEFLRQLEDMMPLTQCAAPHMSFLRCQHDAASGLMEPRAGTAVPWLTTESLRELGIQSAEEMDYHLCQQTQNRSFSPVRTFLSHVRLSTGQDRLKVSGAKNGTWWGGFRGNEVNLQKGSMLDRPWVEESALLYSQLQVPKTKAPDMFGWRLGENPGAAYHKEEQANNGGCHTVQNREELRSEAAPACSQQPQLSPEQDHGYCSLEDHLQITQLQVLRVIKLEEASSFDPREEMENETPEEDEEECTAEEEEDEEDDDEEEEAVAQEMVLPSPQCENRAIAFIMGCPCSDDDDKSSQSDSETSGNGDDDGFDSEGSDLSDSSEDDEDSESEDSDSETERLWTSLCRSVDPYNPRNFTARLCSSSTQPRTIPPSTSPPSTQSTLASSPEVAPMPRCSPSLSSSPPSGHDVWDDSTSASEVDEAESHRLWSSFSCSSDPYSPFNFQAPLRTQGPSSKTPPKSHPHPSTSPPAYKKEEAEERLDSGFSDTPSSSRQCCGPTKKVRFCDDVEEFFASCGEEEEDRRGPWEELARDRCRFLRRCQEVEQSISHCLQPQHRSLVFQRLTLLHFQDSQ